MEVSGITGRSMGTTGFVFALMALGRIARLKKQLKQDGVLDEGFKSECQTKTEFPFVV